ncbi:MAG: sugar kinase, partial [Alphaproteobacteria bacterium]|nr:sugar kinase [Alphaproteobacteria bacterium]
GQTGFGGDTLNTAVYLARLLKGQRARVSYVTRLGDDHHGRDMLVAWQQEGIDCRLVAQIPGRSTGSYKIDVDSNGERSFSYDRDHSPARELFSGDTAPTADNIRHYDALYVSGITLAVLYPEGRARLLNLMAIMKRQGRSVIYDPNHRPSLWETAEAATTTHRTAIKHATCFLPSEEDIRSVFGLKTPQNYLSFLKETAVDEVIFKRGTKAVYVLYRGTEEKIALAVVKHPVDTTAAGDSFNAAYIAGRLMGDSPVQASRKAVDFSRLVIGHCGAIIPLRAMAHFPSTFVRSRIGPDNNDKQWQ